MGGGSSCRGEAVGVNVERHEREETNSTRRLLLFHWDSPAVSSRVHAERRCELVRQDTHEFDVMMRL